MKKVNFAKLERSARFLEVERLAHQLIDAIKHVVPALPIPLVATVLLESPRKGLGAFEVEARVNRLIEELRGHGACVYVSPRHRVESVLGALNMLELRKLVRESQGIYSAVPEEIDVLTYYANSIAHWRQFAIESNDHEQSPQKQPAD